MQSDTNSTTTRAADHQTATQAPPSAALLTAPIPCTYVSWWLRAVAPALTRRGLVASAAPFPTTCIATLSTNTFLSLFNTVGRRFTEAPLLRRRHHYISGPIGRAATSPRRTSAPDMALKLVLLSALLAVALADTAPYRPPPPPPPTYSAPAPSYNAPQPVSPPKYDFSWKVKDDYSGNDYGHQEGRDGYDTQGSYYVQLPDGRLQEVTYTVNGDSGFVAQVNYQGEAQYPTQQGYGSAPSYQPPAPSYQQPRPSYA
ncbi:hypothetical protein O3P69_014853 [Scylla paramamosain]|uniref:Cuticle protein n=1 Tax=Scylla paramamosain TaxID=85552 RepID=A0AAW0TY42_SCYPA